MAARDYDDYDAYYDDPIDSQPYGASRTRRVEGLPSIDLDPIDSEDDEYVEGEHGFDFGRASAKDNAAGAVAGVTSSFSALKDSIAQGRELKQREKELDALIEQLRADREELADREDILANYARLFNEQQVIIDENAETRAQKKAQLQESTELMQDTSSSLERMKSYHDQQLQPLQTKLGRARATADQAKNDERSRKSELNAAEAEVRKADDGTADIAAAMQQQVAAAYAEAKARSESARDALKEIEHAYEVAKTRYDGEEAPLLKSIDELNERIAQIKDEIAELEDIIAEAQDRRQFIDDVYHNPAETDELREAIIATEAKERQMGDENDQLRVQLELSKDGARKAKLAIGIAIAVIIVLIIVLFVFVLK